MTPTDSRPDGPIVYWVCPHCRKLQVIPAGPREVQQARVDAHLLEKHGEYFPVSARLAEARGYILGRNAARKEIE